MITSHEALTRNAVNAWGADGRRWLAALPALVARLERDWGVEVGETFELSYNWVAMARLGDGTPAVLKLGPPEPGHLDREAAALRAWSGCGAVRLLRYDAELGALLLERAEPGAMARDLTPERDEDATAAIAGALRLLHRASAADLPALETARSDFTDHLVRFPGDDPLPRALVELAVAEFDTLCATAARRVVLHGDLHHDNLLRAGSGWLAIDPHGWLGDPGFDAGPMLYNPAGDDATMLALVPRRVEQLAACLGEPLERIRRWGFVAAMLSEVWSAEDGDAGGRPLAVARMLADS